MMRSASLMVLALGLDAGVAHAQLAARRTAIAIDPAAAARAAAGVQRSANAIGALDRATLGRTRADDIRAYVQQARAAIGARPAVPEGLQGLVVAKGVTAATSAEARLAAADSTGIATWQGAGLPSETSANGRALVNIVQTESRAILSWDRFDVGANTTLQFDQKLNGVAQKDWVALNRVVDPQAAPSTILGQVKADGTVVVLNRNGIIFGQGAQVNTNSLLASTLEIGNAFRADTIFRVGANGSPTPVVGASGVTVQDRNLAFIQNGLLQGNVTLGSERVAATLVSADIGTSFYESAATANLAFANSSGGDVIVDRGATITAGTGGFVIFAAPSVTNDGKISAAEGQVSLQSGLAVSAFTSTGGTGSLDPDVRGLVLRTFAPAASGQITNTGLIDAPRGYISLGTDLGGTIINSGLLASTTSVSRNGSISLTGGTISLSGASTAAEAGGIVILPDASVETVPIGSAQNPPQFKTSRVTIGGLYFAPQDLSVLPDVLLGPAAVTFGQNALLLAPSANVDIGGTAGEVLTASTLRSVLATTSSLPESFIDIQSNALIDVSGVKDVQLDASRNSLLIDPLKRNELRDTPNYREVATNGEFSLNGAAVYVDPRISGVRDDGVAWIGSPLIEAGSAASQIGVGAAELMTKGGNLTLAVTALDAATDVSESPRISIARDATIDISGGWVRYADGMVRTSRLLTASGRIVDIADADPNDVYVAIGDGFTEVQAKFGISRTYANAILNGGRFEYGYDEGSDAGSFYLSTPIAQLLGVVHGDAFAGVRQRLRAELGTADSAISGDLRSLQATRQQLPSGGYFHVGSLSQTRQSGLGSDIILAGASGPVDARATILDSATLSAAGLSALSLRTSGAVSFANDSLLKLANGGSLNIEAGRAVDLLGTISAPAGVVDVHTYDLGFSAQENRSLTFAQGFIGSPFRGDDDQTAFSTAETSSRPFDIHVGGTISVAGQWTNDRIAPVTGAEGAAWINGGSISLTVAPSVFRAIGTQTTTNGIVSRTIERVEDLSGSIIVDAAARLNVSSGGYVASNGDLDLSGAGGDVAFVNKTTYVSQFRTDFDPDDLNNTADLSIGGANQSVAISPSTIATSTGPLDFVPSLVPAERRSQVSFETGSLTGFGFAGGGTFTLAAPDMRLGSDATGPGPQIGLDFLGLTGFGALNLQPEKARFVSNLFDNGQTQDSAFREITRFVVGNGETLDLTQTVLPSLLDSTTALGLTGLATGSDILTRLTPVKPTEAWDQRAASLSLGGFSEFDVEAGGTVIGAAGAAITAPRIFNAGRIRIAGGSLLQSASFPNILQSRVVGVRDAALGGDGLNEILGGGLAGQTNLFDEQTDARLAVFRDAAGTQRLTNGELFGAVDLLQSRGFDVSVVFLGRLDVGEGIRLAQGSVTDLSGAAIYNPRAPLFPDGTRQRAGRVVAGGSLSTQLFGGTLSNFFDSSFGVNGNRLVAETGAVLNLSGASGAFDERQSLASFGTVQHWSNGGRLAVRDGAFLTGTTIIATGGDDGDTDTTRTQAIGGTLEWNSAVVRQADSSNSANPFALYAGQMEQAGFDTAILRGGFRVDGDVDWTLGKALLVTTDTGSGRLGQSELVVRAEPGSDAQISAPYVRLESAALSVNGARTSNGAGDIALVADAIDVVGSVHFDVSGRSATATAGSVELVASGDLRLIGVSPQLINPAALPGLTGQLVTNGNFLITAGQVYATTGTGNYQALLEARQQAQTVAESPYLVASTKTNGLIRIDGSGSETPATPYSAGSFLRIAASAIEQNGVVRAPLGRIDIGTNSRIGIGTTTDAVPATASLILGESSLTSVSARTDASSSAALSIPYGTTTDLIEYFFSPTTRTVLTAPPIGELRLSGGSVDFLSGSQSDVRGGGDVFAYEFVPGTGGSRDVLDRFNPDDFSGNAGLQYPDGRQVFAILPKSASNVALFDPIYSADYSGGGGVNLYGEQAGRTVILDEAPGIAAGEYLLLPAHYALLPGGLRIVENVGSDLTLVGSAAALLDGSVVVSGRFGTSASGFAESTRRSFTVQDQDTFSKYSRIESTSLAEQVSVLAAKNGAIAPRLPVDAARAVLSPLTSLKIAGLFRSDAATGGLGAQVDISGINIRIAAPGAQVAPETSNYVLLTTDDIGRLNANSLSIGARRTDNPDGSTRLDVIAQNMLIDSDVTLAAPEILLSVGGQGSRLIISDPPRGVETGARIVATGTLSDNRTGDYIINATARTNEDGQEVDATGVGAFIRVANGAERLVSREGDFVVRNTLLPSRAEIGAASILGQSIAFDSSRVFVFDRRTMIGAAPGGSDFVFALSADGLRIGALQLPVEVDQRIALASRVTLRSPDVINFNAGDYRYNDLVIDSAGIGYGGATNQSLNEFVNIAADDLTLRNSFRDLGPCRAIGLRQCSITRSRLSIDASTATFGSGQFRTFGFTEGPFENPGALSITARNGMFVEGAGGFSTVDLDEANTVDLRLNTPFLVDRTKSSLTGDYVRPDYVFEAIGNIVIDGTGLSADLPTSELAPGSAITLSRLNDKLNDIIVNNATIRATAGLIDIEAGNSLSVTGSSALLTPGFTRTIGDALDPVRLTAGGGNIRLSAFGGGGILDVSSGSNIVTDNGIGDAGSLSLNAPGGEIRLLGSINAGLATGSVREGSFSYDAGQSEFDLTGFVDRYGAMFQGGFGVRTGAGDLELAAGRTLRAEDIKLVADGGALVIGGAIDASGKSIRDVALADPTYAGLDPNGGDIELYGLGGVTLAATSSLTSTTGGYADGDTRQAKGGDVHIGVGANLVDPAEIRIEAGASINLAAIRSGERAVFETVLDNDSKLEQTVTHIVESDQGGTLSLRAPVIANGNGWIVNISDAGTYTGVSEKTVEGYRVFDLDAIAASGDFAGVTQSATAFINVLGTTNPLGQVRPNLFSDKASGSIPDFIRNFQLTDSNGNALSADRIRPGVELISTRDIQFVSRWNLGAGEIVNLDGTSGLRDALADPEGLLQASALGTGRVEVIYGKEDELFDRYVDLLYRVHGPGNERGLRGEAPIVSVRSALNLTVENSISDGFYSFHDSTNADYISYQLGGGDRTFAPAITFTCGAALAAGCNDSFQFEDIAPGPVAAPIPNRVTIQFLLAQQGQETSPFFANAPYSASVNSAGAVGTGDPLGVMELFPVLADGSSVHSSSINLVAGAVLDSANPLQIDSSVTRTLTVSGETSYDLVAKRGDYGFAGPLQFSYRYLIDPTDVATRQLLGNVEGFIDFVNDPEKELGEQALLDPNYYTVLNWGAGSTGSAAAARNAARAPGSIFMVNNRAFVGNVNNPTGVAAPLADVLAFLTDDQFGGVYRRAIENGTPGFNTAVNLLTPLARIQRDTVYVGTKVRTGDGDIRIATSGTIDLRRSRGLIQRGNPDPSGANTLAQVGGTAIYTAGVRINPDDYVDYRFATFNAPPLAHVAGPGAGVESAPVLARNGGEITLDAGRDILGRRDEWNEAYGQTSVAILGVTDLEGNLQPRFALRDANTNTQNLTYPQFGTNRADQRWRYGQLGEVAIATNFFASGVGALAGGDVTIRAEGSLSDLTISLDAGRIREPNGATPSRLALGSGNLDLQVNGDVLGGQIDIASGLGKVLVGGDTAAAGVTRTTESFVVDDRNLLKVRIGDAHFGLRSNGDVDLAGIASLGAGRIGSVSANEFSLTAGASINALGSIEWVGNRLDLGVNLTRLNGTPSYFVLPSQVSLTAQNGSIDFGGPKRAFLGRAQTGGAPLSSPLLLAPSPYGQLSLTAGGDIVSVGLAMSDASRLLQGGLSSLDSGVGFPGVLPTTGDAILRTYHNRNITHLDNPEPVRITVGGSLDNLVLSLPKAARIHAGEDIQNLQFDGQNLADTDVTRIVAGRDITGSVSVSADATSVVASNNIILGGPGSLFVEAGRDAGPFATSATINGISVAGGIRTVGNEYNPWLGSEGADLYFLFGVGNGADYDTLQQTYLNPANLGRLDGDLFEQVSDLFGNQSPDRGRPIYAPILAEWLKTNEPQLFASVLGNTALSGSALKQAAYERFADLYSAFAALDPLRRNQFLLSKLYFGELAAPADPNGTSFNQFVRGYRAVQTLFPSELGYTDNLSAYVTDPATISTDNPLGVPERRLENGQPIVAQSVTTGNVDLRLATLQTARGGDISIIGPGGNFIAGSVVRTDAQVARRSTTLAVTSESPTQSASLREFGQHSTSGTNRFQSIPLGFEGILTLRGGAIRGFTDGSFVLNQSRLFTQRGGDVSLWSSNGDLNAGQGPRSSSNFPPISVRFSQNGLAELDSAGSVSGAGIAAFRPSPEVPASSVILVAPVGTVDAGDAGVRASGNVFVAAARVANADNFQAGGAISGVPSLAVTTPPAVPANAAASIAANLFKAADTFGDGADRATRIFVDILGYFGGPNCPEGETADGNGECRKN